MNNPWPAFVSEDGKHIIHPKDARLALKVIPFTGMTASGIQIAHSERMPMLYGIVVGKGPGCDPRLEFGHRVRFKRHACEVYERNKDEEYWFVWERDVECFFTGDVHLSLAAEQEEPPASA